MEMFTYFDGSFAREDFPILDLHNFAVKILKIMHGHSGRLELKCFRHGDIASSTFFTTRQLSDFTVNNKISAFVEGWMALPRESDTMFYLRFFLALKDHALSFKWSRMMRCFFTPDLLSSFIINYVFMIAKKERFKKFNGMCNVHDFSAIPDVTQGSAALPMPPSIMPFYVVASVPR